jgi:hypothetical protein
MIDLRDHAIKKFPARLAPIFDQVDIRRGDQHYRILSNVIAKLFIIIAIFTKYFLVALLKLAGDSLLFTYPVGNERPDGSRPFSHAIAIKMSVKQIVLSIEE